MKHRQPEWNSYNIKLDTEAVENIFATFGGVKVR